MFDAQLRKLIDPALNRAATAIARSRVSANAITLAGAALVAPLFYALLLQQWQVALGLIVANRLLDGLDGAVARIRGPSLWGGYLDSLCDYLFYVAVPVGFAFAAPANELSALLLLASFTLTAVSFLALAAILAGRDLGHGDKAFSYSTGLMEGGETIGFFLAFCLFPALFPQLALVFAALCLLTVAQRLWMARKLLKA
ncbi:CDP-alcohol phosphatidyltransferase family protein [Sphingorhabdus sp.]|jgi:phosphatidylglycerophosphate synthase|uniref:CDP-alcohol phosphatidyltransferase family protein n=1 Tax=Sphingorhabdus sp. TaxID=1902408 RepID=UPI003BB0C9A0|nr:CDP-alcohol phosphatidyltransferase family protein [Sphingomonadales bacterium]MBK9432320.1 CDP-alcohol phosphatidyltransferase family protein [Sphingomonadales bacterium]MBL0022147.1 CDP-alcohol phosphatidyltransferase family protein [Sphingomonadales bacterium]